MQVFDDLINQLNAKTAKNPETGCWEWQGVRLPKGYGQISINSRHHYVHRIAFQIFKGPVEKGQHVLHKCDNPPCWNPDHLFIGTNTENRHDSVAKGRHHRGSTHNWAKLTEADVLAIRQARRSGLTLKALAEQFSVPYKTIDKIVYRASWKHLP